MKLQGATKVLIIDDDPISNLINEMQLRGFLRKDDIFSCTEPGVGIAHMRKWLEVDSGPRGIVFLDINMPYMSGWDLLDVVEADFNIANRDRIEIFMISSSVDNLDKKRASNHPLVSGYLEKPLSPAYFNNIFINEKDPG